MKKVVTIGELLIDFISKDSITFTKHAGGAPANVAATVSKLGGKGYFVGQVGADEFGDYLIDELKKVDVHTNYIYQTKEAKTSLAFVSLDKKGERSFTFYRNPGADQLFTQKQVPNDLEEETILHFCSVSLSDYPIKDAHKKIIQEIRDKHGFISFDPNLRLNQWDDHEAYLKTIKEFIPLADLLKISHDELEFITESKEVEIAIKKLFVGHIKYIILTKGKDGASFYFKDGTVLNQKGFNVKTVDTTGAGDAFIGAFLYQLSKLNKEISKENIKDILEFSNATAALVTTKYGSIQALPAHEEVVHFIKQNK